MLKEGLTFSQTMVVGKKDTAVVHGSGSLDVFATPAMVALMENTAVQCVQDYLEKGMDSVGIQISTNHIKATRVGKTVKCTATVSEVSAKKIQFKIEAFDDDGVIGSASHLRYMIDPEKFMSRL